MAVLRALGIPPGLYSGSGGASREAYRQFYAITCNPLARLMLAEFRVKLGIPELTLSLDDLAAIRHHGQVAGGGQLGCGRGAACRWRCRWRDSRTWTCRDVPAAPPVPTE